MPKGRSDRRNKGQSLCQRSRRCCRRSRRRSRSLPRRRSRRWSWTGPSLSRDSSAQKDEMGSVLVCTRSSFLQKKSFLRKTTTKDLDSLLTESDAEHDAVPEELVMVIR